MSLINWQSGFVTDVASIRRNNVTELTSGLLAVASSLRKNDVTDKLALGFVTDVVSIRRNDATELEFSLLAVAVSLRKKNGTDKLTSSFATDITHTTDLATVSSLVPFLITALPFNLHCITGIVFTYHPALWHNHATWIRFILSLFRLLISSLHLKYIFLFSHQHSNDPCPLAPLVSLIQSVISSWNISPHLILSHHLGDNVICSSSFL